MRAMVVPEYGGPDVFELQDVPEPEPGPGEVSVSVEFAGVNFTDVRNRRGDGAGELPLIPGVEAAGRVRRLGEGVSGMEVGEPVAVWPGGHAYAEVVVADARRVFPLPDELVGEPVSGGLPVIVPVALLLLRWAARVQPDESMLVHGASGGVATALVQATDVFDLGPVYGTVSTGEKQEYSRNYPYADVFIRSEFPERLAEATDGRGVDIAFDPIGGETRRRSFEALAPFGRLVHFGNASHEPEVPPDAVDMRARGLGYIGYSAAQHFWRDPEGTRPVFLEGIDLVASGDVEIDVTEVIPLDEAPRAHKLMGDRKHVGKMILAM